mmetsp:Transcript_36883/g.119005  ORF Transcript_36883/g.119005 Transcript_36883/m.119005 type:complete len:157 (+) Transcript_36883:401-871(+)
MTAQLDKAVEFLRGLPPKKYDRRMEDRISVLKPDSFGDVAWLTSPQRSQLQSGSAECVSTVRAIRRLETAPAPAAPPAAAPVAEPATMPPAPDVLTLSDLDSEAESEAAADGEKAEPPCGSKRARKATKHFHPSKAAPKKPKPAKGGDQVPSRLRT